MSRSMIIALALTGAVAASAAPFPTQQFTATAQVNANCTVVESGTLSFGNYDPLTANATAAQPGSGASLSLKCTRGSHPMVSLDNGLAANFGTGSDATRRAMVTGATGTNQALSYDLLQPSAVGGSATASATKWGNGGGTGAKFDAGVTTVTPGTALTVNIFGSIPGNQDVVVGTFNDTVTATVEF